MAFDLKVNKLFGDHIISETNRSALMLRRLDWGGNIDDEDPNSGNLDLRRWTFQEDGTLRALKGVTLRDKEPHDLTQKLVDLGFGDTTKIMRSLSKRGGEFEYALETWSEPEEEDDSSDDGELFDAAAIMEML